ncbi:25S rRNA (uridine(2843)-N(3))-methyltransferase [Fusarium subglutinans]|uniref:25S rRNA (Uridine(2843)-N(3))-methyltransferase n=1 Tax=Gibberella subglutinans TaxID=42677 RepID=A0A8H5NXP6_GIBSU|nr:25S rRNA (uridine(2843)-N(3))-methyltransferase [Fusarium subglutinans]KAF5580763.1 25S rRNA (uridine(2843)-N(3))-methyltransferase [Fusarium subglutinans]
MVKKTGPSKKAAPSKQSSSSKQSSKKSSAPLETSSPALQSEEQQQRLLNIFSSAFNNVLTSADFSRLLQEIKQALFNREFAAAFGREDYLEAYAARWSPTRALCYAAVLLSIKKHLDGILITKEETNNDTNTTKERSVSHTEIAGSTQDDANDTPAGTELEIFQDLKLDSTSTRRSAALRMLSVGGCAAEHVALASYLQTTATDGHLTLLDSGPWTTVISLLESSTTNPPPISKYASTARQAANHPLLEKNQLSLDVVQRDVLDLDLDSLSVQCANGRVPIILTLLFTLNELYTTAGIGKTTKFLKNLGQVLASDSLVLVVDSPGSYSEAALGKEKKKYPMQWLLDHTLIETETPGYSWEKLQSGDSIWFRLPEGLSYPIPLENMRYQMHLYRLQKP